jgi:hypothetical protein
MAYVDRLFITYLIAYLMVPLVDLLVDLLMIVSIFDALGVTPLGGLQCWRRGGGRGAD